MENHKRRSGSYFLFDTGLQFTPGIKPPHSSVDTKHVWECYLEDMLFKYGSLNVVKSKYLSNDPHARAYYSEIQRACLKTVAVDRGLYYRQLVRDFRGRECWISLLGEGTLLINFP